MFNFETKKNDAQKMKFSFKASFSKCEQIRRWLWIFSHLLKKSLTVDFIFHAAMSIILAAYDLPEFNLWTFEGLSTLGSGTFFKFRQIYWK